VGDRLADDRLAPQRQGAQGELAGDAEHEDHGYEQHPQARPRIALRRPCELEQQARHHQEGERDGEQRAAVAADIVGALVPGLCDRQLAHDGNPLCGR
jgi:hypothetical protein